jgi:hypothetical protein
MTRLAAALALFLAAGPALAGGSAPDVGNLLWPQQAPVVIVSEVQNESWWLRRGVTQEQLLWAVFDGGSPDLAPAPIPVPPAGLLMFSGLLILTLIRKG